MKRRFLGIDIGTTNIKFAEVKMEKESVLLGKTQIVEAPKFFIQNGQISQVDEFCELIRDALKKGRFKSKRALIVLNDSMVITRDIKLPPAGRADLIKMVKLELSEFLPSSIDEYTVRYRVLASHEKNKDNMNYILTAVARTDVLNNLYKIFSDIGLKLFTIDITQNAMFKFMERLYKDYYGILGKRSTIAMVDMGAGSVRLTLISEGIPVSQKSINFSSQKIDVMLSTSLDIDRETAENYKMGYGLDFVNKEEENPVAASISSIVAEQVNLLLNELYKSLNVYLSRENDRGLSEIWLTGGMALMKGLKEYIEQAFDVQCRIVDNLNFIKFKSLSKVDSNSIKPNNLLPFLTGIVGASYKGE